LAVLSILLGEGALRAQRRYIDGVFVQTRQGPVELLAYAEMRSIGLLELTYGSMEDVPTLQSGCRVLVSLPAWRATGAFVATEAVFADIYAERRQVRLSSRQLNIYALGLEILDLREPKSLTRILRGVKASDDTPAYVFVGLANGRGRDPSFMRFYPIRIDATTATSSSPQSPCEPAQ
jgi:hypothetical protein